MNANLRKSFIFNHTASVFVTALFTTNAVPK